jgi:hypothetical protein
MEHMGKMAIPLDNAIRSVGDNKTFMIGKVYDAAGSLPVRNSGSELGPPSRNQYENLCQHNDKGVENVRHSHTYLGFAERSTKLT